VSREEAEEYVSSCGEQDGPDSIEKLKHALETARAEYRACLAFAKIDQCRDDALLRARERLEQAEAAYDNAVSS
jgi:hypothetical protein